MAISIEQEAAMQDSIDEFINRCNIAENYKGSDQESKKFKFDLDNIRDFNPKLWSFITNLPSRALSTFKSRIQKALDDADGSLQSEKIQKKKETNDLNCRDFPSKTEGITISIEGNLGANFVTPRGLKANLLNKLVRVQGIVTRMSVVRPKLSKSYHYIEETKSGYVQNYKDQYSIEGQGEYRSKMFPTKDATGNIMSPEYGYWQYQNVQKLVIQEMPERAPTGQIPRSIMVFLENELVDIAKPGDRVEVTGIFKSTTSMSSQTSGVFRSVIVGIGVKVLVNRSEKIKMNPEDIKNIKEVAKREDWFEILAASIAPTIQGHRNIKKSVLLQLLGGAEKNLQSGIHLRGDINVLLIGDPSTAKSQMLRHVMNLANISISTTGRGSSGVGLTAAVSLDKESGERHLEAGAMVLADKGVICIDEFDKMDDGDRVAIHEVMEQQTVTVAKAGIHASLNARWSVLAAANPIYGDYDNSLPAAKNIGLPDTLLSRFDLLFVVLDEHDAKIDSKIAERVIKNHSFKDNKSHNALNKNNDDYLIEPEIINEEDEKKITQIYEKNDSELYLNIEHEIVTIQFLKKYIMYAKESKAPVLDKNAAEFWEEAYKQLRQKAENPEDSNNKKLPITVRTLETLIRLATAHSKMRIHNDGLVTENDMQVALKLMNFAIFDVDDDEEGGKQEVEIKPKKTFQYENSKCEDANKRSKRKRNRENNIKTEIKEESKAVKRVKRSSGDSLRADDVQAANNTIDSSIRESSNVTDRKKFLFRLMIKQQNRGIYEIKLSELWELVLEDDKGKSLFINKDQMMEAVNVLADGNQIILTTDNSVALI